MVILIKESDISYEGLTTFHDSMMQILSSSNHHVTLDFRNIAFSIDSLVIGEIMKLNGIMEEKNLTLKLSNVNKLTKTIFRLNKLDTILNLVD